jgi:rubrerythrin
LIKKELISSVEELYHLQNCELAMGEYYQYLAEQFPNERLFWEEAISDEVNHARMAGRLIALVTSNPQAYSPGKYRVAVLETFLSGIYEQIERLNRNALSPHEALKIANDYEDSAILSKPYEIVTSRDQKYNDFRKIFSDDIAVHHSRISQYITQKLGIQNNTGHIKLHTNEAASTKR